MTNLEKAATLAIVALMVWLSVWSSFLGLPTAAGIMAATIIVVVAAETKQSV